jgi:hypothetical protein
VPGTYHPPYVDHLTAIQASDRAPLSFRRNIVSAVHRLPQGSIIGQVTKAIAQGGRPSNGDAPCQAGQQWIVVETFGCNS